MGGQRQGGGRPALSSETKARAGGEQLRVEEWLPSDLAGLLQGDEATAAGGRRLVGLAGLLGLAGLAGGLAVGLAGREPGPLEQPLGSPELAYSDPVIKQGSVLLSRPGGHFALRQQYFHKAVVLITKHQDDRDIGLILNRPTSLVTTQLGIEGPPWQILFGGDCDGLSTYASFGDASFYCLHTLDRFAASSREIVRGVYLMDFERGREIVQRGEARTTDFLLVVGYCGWGPGQLQRELDRGNTWKMASVDSRIIIRELRDEAMEMRAMSRLGLDDGIAGWRRLYAAVDAGFPGQASEQEDLTGDRFADLALREWVEAALEGGILKKTTFLNDDVLDLLNLGLLE